MTRNKEYRVGVDAYLVKADKERCCIMQLLDEIPYLNVSLKATFEDVRRQENLGIVALKP